MVYKNLSLKKDKKNFFHVLLWALGYYKEPSLGPVPPDFAFPNLEEKINSLRPQVTWVNHSTFLIKAFSFVLLTDPIWSKRCSPLSFLGPKRHFEPPFPLRDIASLDFVLISHDHYDHLDYKTVIELDALFPHLKWIVPKGVKKWFLKKLPSKDPQEILELEWNESYTFKRGDETITFTATPAEHFSGRNPFRRDHTLWMGVATEIEKKDKKKKLYFSGDTGYNESLFKETGKSFGPFDLSLLPIGAYLPRGFMEPVHVSPEEAVKIHKEVGSLLSVAGHFGTFKLSSEEFERPPFDLFMALKKENIPWQQFRVINPGQIINW